MSRAVRHLVAVAAGRGGTTTTGERGFSSPFPIARKTHRGRGQVVPINFKKHQLGRGLNQSACGYLYIQDQSLLYTQTLGLFATTSEDTHQNHLCT